MNFIVYRIFSSNSTHSYYGYCMASKEPMQAFKESAKRDEVDRASHKFIEECQDDFQVEILDVCQDEVEAWESRNNHRMNVDSISHPSLLPVQVFTRASKKAPEKVSKIKSMVDALNASSARKAFKMGLWTLEQVKSLANHFNRLDIIKDLDDLKPQEFRIKYGI